MRIRHLQTMQATTKKKTSIGNKLLDPLNRPIYKLKK